MVQLVIENGFLTGRSITIIIRNWISKQQIEFELYEEARINQKTLQ